MSDQLLMKHSLELEEEVRESCQNLRCGCGCGAFVDTSVLSGETLLRWTLRVDSNARIIRRACLELTELYKMDQEEDLCLARALPSKVK